MPTEISGSTGVNKIQDGTVVDADINSSAAIAGSKISGSFGKVLQVVNAYHASEVTTNSTSWIDTGLTATITPSSTSSKILILINQTAAKQGDAGMRIRFLRGSTVIRTVTEKVGFTGSGDDTWSYIGTVSVGWLDTPSTTSATTYHTEFRASSSGHNVIAQVDNDTSTITLMEIAA